MTEETRVLTLLIVTGVLVPRLSSVSEAGGAWPVFLAVSLPCTPTCSTFIYIFFKLEDSLLSLAPSMPHMAGALNR